MNPQQNQQQVNPLNALGEAINQGVHKPDSLPDEAFEGLLDNFQKTAIGQGIDAVKVSDRANAARDARSQALLDDQKLNWGQQIGHSLLQPFVAIAGTAAAGVEGATGWLADRTGDIADKLGASGLAKTYHAEAESRYKQVENWQQYGIDLPGAGVGRFKIAGGKQFVEASRGQGSWIANVANASLDYAGNTAEAASYAVGDEGGVIKTAAKVAGTYAVGEMAKDIASGAGVSKTVQDGMSIFLGGVLTGGLLHSGGAALGSIGAAISKTALGSAILEKMGNTIESLQNFSMAHSNNPELIESAGRSAQAQLETQNMGLMGLIFNKVLRPETDMLEALNTDVARSRSLIEGQKNAAFGNVFNDTTRVNPEAAFGKTASMVDEHMPMSGGGDEARAAYTKMREQEASMPSDQLSARNRFNNWLTGIKNLMDSNSVPTKALDPYIMASRPSFGGTGEYDKFASQILASLRNEFGSYLNEAEPQLAAQFKRGMTLKNTIDSRYKTGLVDASHGAIDQEDFMRQIVSGEVKANSPEVNTFVNNLSPSVKSNFQNSLVNTVSMKAWDTLNNGRFGDAAYKEAGNIIKKFLDDFKGTSALNPTDEFHLAEWQDALKQGGVPDMTKMMATDSVLGASDVAAQNKLVQESNKVVESLSPVMKQIQAGNLSEVGGAYNKLSAEQQSKLWATIPDEEGKFFVGQSVYSDRVSGALKTIDPDSKFIDLSNLLKQVKSVVDDEGLFKNGFNEDQRLAMQKFVTFAEAAKDLSHVSLTKLTAKIVGGAALASTGHILWGSSIATRGIIDVIKDFMANSAAATPKMEKLIVEAQQFAGETNPKTAEVLTWVSDMLKKKGVLTAETELGTNTGKEVSK